MKPHHILTTWGVIIAASSAHPADAQDRKFPRFPTWHAQDWKVEDEGKQFCTASFHADGKRVLEFIGPIDHPPELPFPGAITHYGNPSGKYAMPKDYRMFADIASELAVGDVRYPASGVVVGDTGEFSIITEPDASDFRPSTLEILEKAPESAKLSAYVKGTEIFAVPLTSTKAAAEALRECTEFVAAQKRPAPKVSIPPTIEWPNPPPPPQQGRTIIQLPPPKPKPD